MAFVLIGDGHGAFGPRTTYDAGTSPYGDASCVAAGDLDGDGALDLAVTNEQSNTLSMLLGNGDGTFRPRTTLATGGWPVFVANADLNSDGRSDPVVANSEYSVDSSSVSIFLGDGHGGLGPRTDLTTGAQPHSVAIRDLSNDGMHDLVVANYYSGTISVLLGHGDGSFGGRSDFRTGDGPYSVAVDDFDGDGKPDVVTANAMETTVSVLAGDGLGGFGSRSDFGSGDHPYWVAVSDLNGDHRPDLAVANATSDAISVMVSIAPGAVGVGSDPVSTVPAIRLGPPQPNPSRGPNEIRMELPAECVVDVQIFDPAGRKVRTLLDGSRMGSGAHAVRWDGRDHSGAPVRAGIYLVDVRAGHIRFTRRAVILH